MEHNADTAFDETQFDAIYPPGVERHYWNICRNQVIADRLTAIGVQGPILEVGCGKGLVVEALRKKGFPVTGVELAQVPVLESIKDHVRTGTDALDLDPSFRNSVSTLLLLDVIEHLEHPSDFLSHLRSGFPGLRWLVLTVPARQELFSNYDDFNNHYRRYDLGMLRSHIPLQNNDAYHAGYFFHSLYPAALVQLKLSGKRPLGFQVPSPGLASWLHHSLGKLMILDHKVLPAQWRGTSIIASISFGDRSR